MIGKLSITVEVDLKTLLGMAPGDDCPDRDCDGKIREVTLAWGVAEGSEYLNGEGRCGLCNDLWTTIERPTYEEAHEQERKETEEEQEGTAPGHLRKNSPVAVYRKMQGPVHGHPYDED